MGHNDNQIWIFWIVMWNGIWGNMRYIHGLLLLVLSYLFTHAFDGDVWHAFFILLLSTLLPFLNYTYGGPCSLPSYSSIWVPCSNKNIVMIRMIWPERRKRKIRNGFLSTNLNRCDLPVHVANVLFQWESSSNEGVTTNIYLSLISIWPYNMLYYITDKYLTNVFLSACQIENWPRWIMCLADINMYYYRPL